MYLKYHVRAQHEREPLHKCANNYFRIPFPAETNVMLTSSM